MPSFVLDPKGGEEVLKVLAAQAIVDIAQLVQSKAGEGATITTSVTNERRGGGRFRARVSVPAAAQAKDGVLTRALGELGLLYRPFKKRGPKPRDANAATPVKRKRGRPRKNPEAVVPTVKRKRGRPRKNPTN